MSILDSDGFRSAIQSGMEDFESDLQKYMTFFPSIYPQLGEWEKALTVTEFFMRVSKEIGQTETYGTLLLNKASFFLS